MPIFPRAAKNLLPRSGRHTVAAWLACALVSGLIAAAPVSTLTTELSATKRVVTHDAENRTVESWVPFTKLLPGEEVTYTITCTNTGTEPAADVVVSLPIPVEMVLSPTPSTSGVEQFCSIDDGKTFDRFEQLRVVAPDGASRPASPEDVRYLRWKFTQPIAPGATAKVDCRARLK